ncbi:MAG: hypothetical protein V4719_02915, partial [Planctomycetota bacterium]
LFEALGAMFLFLNVRQLYRDKELKGVDWRAVAFFFSWSLWNLYYYPAMNQPWSFFGAILICSMNFAWLALAGYYWRQRRAVRLNLQPRSTAEIASQE